MEPIERKMSNKLQDYGTIYVIMCKINGKEYVGQTTYTIKKRWKDHKSAAKSGKQGKLYDAIREYCPDNFTVTELHKCSTNLEDMNHWEIHYIAERNTFENGYNSTIGGQGCQGWVCSEEIKLKKSIANKGKLPALREKYDHNGNQLPMYITNSIRKNGTTGYRVKDHPALESAVYKSIDFTSNEYTPDEKLQMAMKVLQELNDGTFVDTRVKKEGIERGVQIMKGKGYQVGFNGKTIKSFGSKKLTMEEKLELANQWSRENSHLYPPENKVQ